MSDIMSASIEEDKMLASLSEQIDTKLLEWLTEHKVPTLNLIAIMLARMTWLSKQSNCREDFLELLKAPEKILTEEDSKDYLH